ncbi:MAG: hypothetical protein GY856_54200, partial [bacterium]|nr:hypothetical protein [bacterium]
RRAVLTVSAALLLTAIVCLAQPAPVGSPFPIDTRGLIADAADGRYAVAWKQSGATDKIFARTFRATGEATSPKILVAEGPDLSLRAADAEVGGSAFIVTWREGPEPSRAFTRRYDFDGLSLGSPGEIDPACAHSRRCSDSAGRFVVVWQSYESDNPPISYLSGRRCDADGQPDSEVWDLAYPYDPRPRHGPTTCTPDGNFLVSWIGYNYRGGPNYRELYVQRFDASGDSLGRSKTVSTGEVADDGAAIAMSPEGRWAAIWHDPAAEQVVTRFYDEDGQSLGPPMALAEPFAPRSGESRGFAALYHAAERTFTLLWTLPITAAAPQDEDALFAVLGQRFDTAGRPRGPVFQPLWTADHDASARRHKPGFSMAAAGDERGNFVLRWASLHQEQLLAQRFNATHPGSLVFSRPRLVAGEAGTEAVLTVRRIDGNAGAVSVDYTTIDGTALADADFEPSSGRLTFDDQDSQAQTLPVPILDDDAEEALETLVVTLAEPTGGAELGSPHQTAVEIRDDDATPPLVPSGPPIRVSDGRDPEVALTPTGEFLVVWDGSLARRFDHLDRPLDEPVHLAAGIEGSAYWKAVS